MALGLRERPPDSAPPDCVPAGGGAFTASLCPTAHCTALETRSLGGGQVLNEADAETCPTAPQSSDKPCRAGNLSQTHTRSCLLRGEAGEGRLLSGPRKTTQVWRKVIMSVGARECQ